MRVFQVVMFPKKKGFTLLNNWISCHIVNTIYLFFNVNINCAHKKISRSYFPVRQTYKYTYMHTLQSLHTWQVWITYIHISF